jgi:hypothetical protein
MIERRHADRFEIPGALVNYKLKDGLNAQTPLKDITNAGARFEIGHIINRGDFVELDIRIPGKDPISVKGNVVWATNFDAAIQFVPFGTDERYNSFKSYKLLKSVITDCVNTVY